MNNLNNVKKLLLVEGKDDCKFFDALLAYQGINNVRVYDVKGDTGFKKELTYIKKGRYFKNIEIIGLVRDADQNPKGAFESLKNSLRKNNLTPPTNCTMFTSNNPKIGIFIMPNNGNKGSLEDLCLKTVEDHEKMDCTIKFCDCVSNHDDCPTHKSKARVQVFLASMPRVVNELGKGAQKGYWDFDSIALTDLKQFLDNFR